MKHTIILLLTFLAVAFVACTDNTGDVTKQVTITGYVQKGPFNVGASVQVAELKDDLSPTGRTFNAQISDNSGRFTVPNVTLTSDFVELTADGFYFNEVTGGNSTTRLSLTAIANLANASSVNVNVLSHLEKARTKYLITNGADFTQAKQQAQNEVLAIFEMSGAAMRNSEQLNISQAQEDNAILLAVSVILQGRRSVADLSELLANISIDIEQDGTLDNPELGSALINHAKNMNLAAVRTNLENRYNELGVTVEIPDFEQQVTHFKVNTGFEYTQSSLYPEQGSYGRNLLALADGALVCSSETYSFAADLPQGVELKIVLKAVSGVWGHEPFNINGWNVSNFANSQQTFTATESGKTIDLPIHLPTETSGSLIIEYYEYGSLTPTQTKTISWEYMPDNSNLYPAQGAFGENLLALADSSILEPSKQYSIAVNLPENSDTKIPVIIHCYETGSFSVDESQITNWDYFIIPQNNQINLQCFGKNMSADLPIVFEGSGYCTVEFPYATNQIHTYFWGTK